jgi:hypothetical protein
MSPTLVAFGPGLRTSNPSRQTFSFSRVFVALLVHLKYQSYLIIAFPASGRRTASREPTSEKARGLLKTLTSPRRLRASFATTSKGHCRSAKSLPCGRSRNKPYCFGLGEAFAPGLGEADGPFRASLRVSTRVRRRVFFGDGDGDAVLVTAAFAGLGAGVGSTAKTLD